MATSYAFFRGEFVPLADARISVMTHAFNYGTGVFEGIRAYWNEREEQLYVFKLREHYERLHRSCRIMRIGLKYSVDELTRLTCELLRRCGYRQDVYIRPLAYKSSEVIGVRLHNLEDDVAIFAAVFGKYVEVEEARCKVSSWRRIDDSMIPARAKVTGIYVNSALAKTEAVEEGYDEAILLNADGHVAEGSGENIFLLRNGVLITPSVSDNILEGITRNFVMQLAEDELGLRVVERAVDRSELYIADEVFLTGTAAEIQPVVEIDRRTIGNGKVGPVTTRLKTLFYDIVRGYNKKYSEYCTPVYIKA